MTDTVPAETPAIRQPILNAPLLVIGVAVLLVALHAAFEFASPISQLAISYDYALAPQRFWAPAGSDDVYPTAIAGLLTLLSSGLLHADWLHVLVNSMMLLALGILQPLRSLAAAPSICCAAPATPKSAATSVKISCSIIERAWPPYSVGQPMPSQPSVPSTRLVISRVSGRPVG